MKRAGVAIVAMMILFGVFNDAPSLAQDAEEKVVPGTGFAGKPYRVSNLVESFIVFADRFGPVHVQCQLPNGSWGVSRELPPTKTTAFRHIFCTDKGEAQDMPPRRLAVDLRVSDGRRELKDPRLKEFQLVFYIK